MRIKFKNGYLIFKYINWLVFIIIKLIILLFLRIIIKEIKTVNKNFDLWRRRK